MRMNLKKVRLSSKLFCIAKVFSYTEWPAKRKKKKKWKNKLDWSTSLKIVTKASSFDCAKEQLDAFSFPNQITDAIVLFTSETMA